MEDKNQHINKLLLDCKKGNQSAQMEIYKRYYKAMYNVSLRIVNNSFDAEDIMQESFLVAFQKLASFRGEVAFGAWLKRIVVNNSLTQLKKNKRFEEIKLEVVTDSDEEETVSIDYKFLKANVILEKMKELKDNYRIALNLHLIEGYDHEEISKIMEISYQNSKTIVSRAKSKLKKILEYERQI